MPVKNIIPGQRVAKEKLERARELRCDRLLKSWSCMSSDLRMKRFWRICHRWLGKLKNWFWH